MTPDMKITHSLGYTRKGIEYKAYIVYEYGYVKGRVTLSYGFFSYHLIKWIHGEETMKSFIVQRVDQLKKELSEWHRYNDVTGETQ